MKYDNIIKEIDNLNAVDFTMESFKTIGILSQTINRMYGTSLMENDQDARKEYDIVRGHLHNTIFDILKRKLGYEDEIINNILSFMDFANSIQEIYVINDNVVVNLKTKGIDGEKEILYSLPNDISYEFILNDYEDNKVSNKLNKNVKTK